MIKANEISNINREAKIVNIGIGFACTYVFNHEVKSSELVEGIALNNVGKFGKRATEKIGTLYNKNIKCFLEYLKKCYKKEVLLTN